MYWFCEIDKATLLLLNKAKSINPLIEKLGALYFMLSRAACFKARIIFLFHVKHLCSDILIKQLNQRSEHHQYGWLAPGFGDEQLKVFILIR